MLPRVVLRSVLALRPPPPPLATSARPLSEEVTTPEEPKKKKKVTPLLKRIWIGKTKAEEEAEDSISEEDKAWLEEKQRHEDFLKEQRREELARRKNKSRLRYSDRLRLMGKAPLEGLELETEDFHCTQEYKRHMFGLYGSEGSGLSPAVCWPSRETMEEQREWERVFYDGVEDVRDRMDADRRRKEAEEEHARKREDEIAANLLKMDLELKQWQTRVDARNRVAEKERQRREKVLADLRQEYGYDMDPTNPHYAEKIAEKEKQYKKAEKEEKKRRRAEIAAAQNSEEQASKQSSKQ